VKNFPLHTVLQVIQLVTGILLIVTVTGI